jgi:hypothetical protein
MPSQLVRRRDVLRIAIGSAGAAVAAGACGGDANLVPVAPRAIDPAMIDRDPLALLPSGAVGLAGGDARQLFATNLGNDVDQIVRELVPLGPESNFEARRDVDRVTAGFYAMSGVDLCAVVQGRFDAAAIERAAEAKKVMPSGKAIVKTRYAEQNLYTVGNLGFTVLTPKTMLSGNEVGMRRALDRLRYQQEKAGDLSGLERAVPAWMVEVVETKNASFAFAGDFSESSAGAAASETVPYIAGVQRARVLGNFQQPGVNVAGTLTYKDEQSAANGGSTLKNLSDMGQLAGILTTLAYGTTIPAVDVRQSGKDLAFTTSVDEPTARQMLNWLADEARKSF